MLGVEPQQKEPLHAIGPAMDRVVVRRRRRGWAGMLGAERGRGQQQKRTVAQARQVTRASLGYPHQAGGGGLLDAGSQVRLGRPAQGFVGVGMQQRNWQSGLPVHGADRRPAPAEAAAPQPGGHGEQVGGQGCGTRGQRRVTVLAAPVDEACPVASIKFKGGRGWIVYRVADYAGTRDRLARLGATGRA